MIFIHVKKNVAKVTTRGMEKVEKFFEEGAKTSKKGHFPNLEMHKVVRFHYKKMVKNYCKN